MSELSKKDLELIQRQRTTATQRQNQLQLPREITLCIGDDEMKDDDCMKMTKFDKDWDVFLYMNNQNIDCTEISHIYKCSRPYLPPNLKFVSHHTDGLAKGSFACLMEIDGTNITSPPKPPIPATSAATAATATTATTVSTLDTIDTNASSTSIVSDAAETNVHLAHNKQYFVKVIFKYDPFTVWQFDLLYQLESAFVDHSQLLKLAVTPVTCDVISQPYGLVPFVVPPFGTAAHDILTRFQRYNKTSQLYMTYYVYDFIGNHVTLQDIMNYLHDETTFYSKPRKNHDLTTIHCLFMIILRVIDLMRLLNEKCKFINFDIKPDNFIFIVDKHDYQQQKRDKSGKVKRGTKPLRTQIIQTILSMKNVNDYLTKMRMIDWESCVSVSALMDASDEDVKNVQCYLPALQAYRGPEVKRLEKEEVRRYHEQIMTYSLGVLAMEMMSGPLKKNKINEALDKNEIRRRKNSRNRTHQKLEQCRFWEWVRDMVGTDVKRRPTLLKAWTQGLHCSHNFNIKNNVAVPASEF